MDYEITGGGACLIFWVSNVSNTCNSSGTTTMTDTDYWTIHFGNTGVEGRICLKILIGKNVINSLFQWAFCRAA